MTEGDQPTTTISASMGRSGRWGGAIAWIMCVIAACAGMVAPSGAQPAPPDPWLVQNPRFEPLDGSSLGVDGVGDFRGSIRLARSGNGVAVVNQVALDDYLRGISEVPTSWPLEAQKAQAIAARTYALYEVGRTNVNAPYKQVGADICATDACQVYTGLAKERRAGSEAWISAVESTKSQIITYRGAPIVAKYSSSNGGQTVAGGQPYLRATPDPDDAQSPLHRWRATYPIGEVVRAVGLAAEPSELTRQGDEIVATYLDPEGNQVEQRLSAADFRSRLNGGLARPDGLPLPVPSIRYDAGTADGLVVLDGRGWGHGIGMSQYGALGKALRGMQAPEILASYYAGLRPVPLPPDKVPDEVRVAVALDRAEATVTNTSGRFRVIAGDGRVLAHSATGRWTAIPAPAGAVRLVPPADQAGPPGASLDAVEPAAPRPGTGAVLRIALTGPAALTRIMFTPPGGPTTELDPQKLRSPGPLTVRLGAGTTTSAGTYRVDLEREAGAGRVVTTALVIDIVDPPSPSEAPPTDAEIAAAPPAADDAGADDTTTTPAAPRLATATLPSSAIKALATVLLMAVAAAGAAWVGRKPGIELH